jgi:hypothetical protein
MSRPKRILLVEPPKSRQYYTQYPPLGLLKLAALHRQKGHAVYFTKGLVDCDFKPDIIYVTSLFTYAYEAVHKTIQFYSQKYTKAEITVGGIYASLCSDHLFEVFGGRIAIHKGLLPEAEEVLPDYSLVPDYKTTILFASRGCVNHCHYCSVPKLEPQFLARPSVRHLIYPGHTSIVFWDNNFLASPYCFDILCELEELSLKVDFNQGLDARLLTEDVAERLSRLTMPVVRLAYDSQSLRSKLSNAIELLKVHGFRGREILVYCLFNSEDRNDTPQTFLDRIKDLMNWGVAAYPMRYQSLTPGRKDTYVSAYWEAQQLDMVAKARRVIGYGGAFPPYAGLKRKLMDAGTFEEAFGLRPPSRR